MNSEKHVWSLDYDLVCYSEDGKEIDYSLKGGSWRATILTRETDLSAVETRVNSDRTQINEPMHWTFNEKPPNPRTNVRIKQADYVGPAVDLRMEKNDKAHLWIVTRRLTTIGVVKDKTLFITGGKRLATISGRASNLLQVIEAQYKGVVVET